MENEMMAPIKFLYWVLSVVFAFGLTDAFGRLTYEMATAAVHAHQHHQVSYGNFSRLLWSKIDAKTYRREGER